MLLRNQVLKTNLGELWAPFATFQKITIKLRAFELSLPNNRVETTMKK